MNLEPADLGDGNESELILELEKRNISLTKHQIFLHSIFELVRELLGKSDLYEIAWSITQSLIAKYNLEDCVIYIIKNNVCYQIAAYGPKNPKDKEIYNPMTFSVGQGIVGSVAKSGVAEIITDTSLDSRYIVDDKLRYSEIAVPIFSGEKVIGVFDSEHSQKNFFSQDHLNMFSTIADLISILLKNALVLEEQKEHEHIHKLDILKYKKVFDRVRNAIIVLDGQGKIIDCNNQVVSLFGYRSDALLGLQMNQKIISPIDRDNFDNIFNRIILFDKEDKTEVSLKAIDSKGKELNVKIELSSFTLENKVFVCGVIL